MQLYLIKLYLIIMNNSKMKQYLQQIRKQQHSKTLRVDVSHPNQAAYEGYRLQKSSTMPVTDATQTPYPLQSYQNIRKYHQIDNNTTKDYHDYDSTEKTHELFRQKNAEAPKKTIVSCSSQQSQVFRAKSLLEEVKAFRLMQGKSFISVGRQESCLGHGKQGCSVRSQDKNNFTGKEQDQENYRIRVCKQKKVIENFQRKIDHFQQLTDKLFAFIEQKLKQNRPTNDQFIAVEKQNKKLQSRISQLQSQLDIQRKQKKTQIEQLSKQNGSLKSQLQSAQLQLQRYADELNQKQQSHRDYLATIRIANQKLTELELMYRQVSAKAEKKSGYQEQSILKAKLEDQIHEIQSLREELRIAKDQLGHCRAQIDRRVTQQLKGAEKYQAINQMVEELQELYHDVTKKSQREVKTLNSKITQLEEINATLQQELSENRRIIASLTSQFSRCRPT